MVDREDVGSWLSGPPVGTPGTQAHGTRLGLPPTGPGSLAPVWRRLLALVIDWAACVLIAAAFFDGDPLAQLAVFAVENLLLVGTVGFTLGHRVLGLRVRRVLAPRSVLPAGTVPGEDAGAGAGTATTAEPGPDVPPGPFLALIRTVLLCLVIPAAIWDADGRGLHDRFASTAIVRR
jgi:hypothetical protein